MLWPFIFIALALTAVIWLSWAYLKRKEEQRSPLRFIPTRVHGLLDYVVGVLLVAAPWLFGFAEGGAETWIPVVLGAGAILYSLFTDYELGLMRRIPMSVHLIIDGVSGLLLVVSPFLFGFWEDVMDPHLGFGFFEIIAALTTQTVPYGREASPSIGGAGRAVRQNR